MCCGSHFVAGFGYVAAGLGLWLSTALALGTAFLAAAFGVHVLDGGSFEMRTVGALALRFGFWTVVAAVVWRRPSK